MPPSFSWTNGQKYGPEIQHVAQVKKYLGQIQRSKSKVTGQGSQVNKCFKGVTKILYGYRMGKVLQQEAFTGIRRSDPASRITKAYFSILNQETS